MSEVKMKMSEVKMKTIKKTIKKTEKKVPAKGGHWGGLRVCLVLYCSPLDKAAIFGVERLPRIGV